MSYERIGDDLDVGLIAVWDTTVEMALARARAMANPPTCPAGFKPAFYDDTNTWKCVGPKTDAGTTTITKPTSGGGIAIPSGLQTKVMGIPAWMLLGAAAAVFFVQNSRGRR